MWQFHAVPLPLFRAYWRKSVKEIFVAGKPNKLLYVPSQSATFAPPRKAAVVFTTLHNFGVVGSVLSTVAFSADTYSNGISLKPASGYCEISFLWTVPLTSDLK